MKRVAGTALLFAFLASVGMAVAENAPFPAAHEQPPSWWPNHKPIFELSSNYPQTKPTGEPQPWKSIDFRTQGFDYLRTVLAYIYEGNIPPDREATWDVQNNSIRKWYHAPWMHVGPYGREFIHGLTRERTSRVGELWRDPPNPEAQSWAVGFYNPPGGYTVGTVWRDPKAPHLSAALDFPDGTVAAKLLFTTADANTVPYLKGAFEWFANIHPSVECERGGFDDTSPLCARTVQRVRLLQIDIAVHDERAYNHTNWVFGSFVYDGNSPGKTPWERMVPIGLMWGNDPNVTPSNVLAGYQLQETVINRPAPVQHLGCAGRLNGPVDNPISSCLACHAAATFPVGNMVPDTGCTDSSVDFFQNINTASAKPDTLWFDYSLQLALGFYSFCVENKNYSECNPDKSNILPFDKLLPAMAPNRRQ